MEEDTMDIKTRGVRKLKGRLILFLFLLLLISCNISAFTFDDVKTYDKNSNTFTIENAFGLGEDLVSGTLMTPQEYEVAPGYGKVAEFEISSKEEYKDIIKSFEFYDLNNGNKKVNRDIDVKVLSNGEWIDFNKNEITSGEKITIGLFTEVFIDDKIEWIPTFNFGKDFKIEEWAIWNASLNVGLFGYFYFNDSSEEVNGYNLLAVGGATYTSTNAKIGNSGVLTGEDYFNIGNSINATSQYNLNHPGEEMTINLWIRPSSSSTAGTTDVVISKEINTYSLSQIDSRYNVRGFSTITLYSEDGVIQSNTWEMITITKNSTHACIWIDGTESSNCSASSSIGTSASLVRLGQDTDGSSDWDGLIDEIGFWNRSLSTTEIDQLYNTANGLTYDANPIPAVTIVYPLNISYNKTITELNYTVDGSNLESCWYSTDAGVTNSSPTAYGNNFTGLSSTEGSNLWTVYCNDTSNVMDNDTITFTQDTNAPNLTIQYPSGEISYFKIGNSLELNWTINDSLSGVGSCFYDYNGVNTTVTCSDNTTSFTPVSGLQTIYFYANDTVGNINRTSTSWYYSVLENYIYYNNQTIEGTLEEFVLGVSTNKTITSSSLIYNGTSYSSDILSLGSNAYNISNQILIPDFSAVSNVTFYFNISFSDSTSVLIQEYNQSVYSALLDDCSAYTYNLFNLSLYDERTLENINGSIEVTVGFFNQDLSNQLITLSKNFNSTNNAEVCSNVNLTSTGVYYDLEIRYYSFGFNNTDYIYVPELYNIQKGNSSNFPLDIGLYDLNTNESTSFTINYRDNNYLSRANVLLLIQRKYIDEGIYRTVEAPITSDEGSAIVHLDQNSYKYRITATYNGDILNVFDNPAIFCQSDFTGVCYINLNGKSNPNNLIGDAVDKDFSYLASQDGNTITIDYLIPSGETKTVNVYMLQRSPVTNNITLCNKTLTSSAGSFECNASSSIGDSVVDVNIYWDDQIRRTNGYIQDNIGDAFQLNNYFIGALVMIIITSMFISSPVLMVLSAVLSFVLLGLLFLINGTSVGLLLGAISWLLVDASIIIYKITRREEE